MLNKRCALWCLLSLSPLLYAEEAVTTEVEQVETTAIKETPQKKQKDSKRTQIFVVDLEQVATKSGLARVMSKDLNALNQKYSKELESMKQEIEKEAAELKQKEKALDADALKKRQEELALKDQKFQMRFKHYDEELRKKDFETRSKLIQKLRDEAQKMIPDNAIMLDAHMVIAAKGTDKTEALTSFVEKEAKKMEAPKKKSAKK